MNFIQRVVRYMLILHELFSKRIEEINNEVACEDWYIRLQEEIIKMHSKICAGNIGICQLLNSYDELCIQIHCKTESEIYNKAFKDGIVFSESKIGLV